MGVYKFSVGKVKLKQGVVIKKEIINTTSVEIIYDLTTERKLDHNGKAIDEFKTEERLDITMTYTDSIDYDTVLIKGDVYDIVLETGHGGGGLAATLADCKLKGYSVRASQDTFSEVTLTFSKIGDIDSAPGDPITKQRVKFGAVYIGDSAYVIPEYEGNVNSLIIPTALGVLIRSTGNMGGGQQSIRINGYVKKDSRLELEQYLLNLYNSLSTDKQDLTIEYGVNFYVITNCYFRAGRPAGGNKNFTDFEIELVRSSY